jgi:hypothetical protein
VLATMLGKGGENIPLTLSFVPKRREIS